MKRLLLNIINSLLVVLFFLLSLAPAHSQNVDINILRYINHNRNQNLDGTFKVLSNTHIIPEVTIPASLLIGGLIKKDKKMLFQGAEAGAGILMAVCLSTYLKYLVNRPRPYVTYPDLDNQQVPIGPSFPSGHTTASFALATTLSIQFPKWYVIVPAYTWASAVAYSRMHLGVHYPGDVLGGMVLGSGSAILSHYLNKKLFGKPKKEVPEF